jgi:signal transduction histidine kinase
MDKRKKSAELIIAYKELALQNEEKEKRAAELIIANKKLAFENKEKDKRAAELAIANEEKEKRVVELIIANEEKEKRVVELIIANEEKEKRAAELIIANEELAYQNKEKEKRAIELINAKEHAEESDRLKSAFLTNMSHEIRTPMNGILGFAELLKEPNLTSDEQQDFIQIIQISGARMLNTINNIVDVSKIESGLMKVDIKETNINEKIEFTYKFFKPEVEIKGLQFLFKNSLPAKEAIIKTDNEKVYGILTNLVRNAIKFTFEGSIEFGYEKKGEYLEFFVKDTGVGIPNNQKELIFERFRQGSESHSRGYEGSGLGLSIAKSYIEMLGGEIWVESKEGKGSIFYFTIPYNAVSEEKTAIENVVSAEHKEVEIKKLKILIVEDDEISYSLLTKMLQKISYEVLHAITGVEAVDACRNNPDIDLVLMDIRMPVMDGNEATRQIRQFNKDVIIIAQTAYGYSVDREMAIEAGCSDYISKPISSILLYELIKKHVTK